MSAVAPQAEGRTTRARSREVESTPASPKKSRTLRSTSATIEQQDPKQAGTLAFAAQLPTVTEEAEAADLLRAQMEFAANAPNYNAVAAPQFNGASIAAIQNARGRKGRGKAAAPRNQRQTAARNAPAEAPTAPMTRDQVEQIAQNANNVETVVDPQLEGAPSLAKRSLLDPQQGATRAEFDDSQPSPQFVEMLPQGLEGEGLATQDGGFQAEARPQPKRRGRAPKRPRESDAAYQPADASSNQQEERQPTPRSTPPPSGYAQVQQQAKLLTASLRKDKVPQKRKAWTLEECDSLIDGIGRFGNSYASLKNDDKNHRNTLHDRSAEDLRHKARNMKFDYLKAGIQLPEGFDSVLLDKKFQDKLAALGREYHQVQQRQAKHQKTGRGNSSVHEDASSQLPSES